MKKKGLILTAAMLAAGTIAVPQHGYAQTLQEGQPGGFDLLLFDPHLTKDWSALEDLVNRAYGSQFSMLPDRSAYVAARRSNEDQAIRMDGEDRVLITAQGLGVPDYLQKGLFDTYSDLTPAHFADFDDGLTLVAITYDDGETAVSLALMRDFGTETVDTAGGGDVSDLGGPVLELTEDLKIGLPPESNIISNQTHGAESGPRTIVASIQVPMSVDDATALVQKALEDQGHKPQSRSTPEQGTVAILTQQMRATFAITPLDEEGSIISALANVVN